MSYVNGLLTKGRYVKSDTLIIMIHSKTEGEELPKHIYYGYFNANVFYKRIKKFNVHFNILNKKEDQIIYPNDITSIIDLQVGKYKNIKILTYSKDIYNAVIKSQDILKEYSKYDEPVNISFEYIGKSIHSDYEFSIPSTIFFLYEKDNDKLIEEFCSRTFHVYGCEGYKDEEDKIVPYMNDYARCKAPSNNFKYSFMGGYWGYDWTKDKSEDELEISENYALDVMWKLQELKHLNPIKWNAEKVEVIKHDVEEDTNK